MGDSLEFQSPLRGRKSDVTPKSGPRSGKVKYESVSSPVADYIHGRSLAVQSPHHYVRNLQVSNGQSVKFSIDTSTYSSEKKQRSAKKKKNRKSAPHGANLPMYLSDSLGGSSDKENSPWQKKASKLSNSFTPTSITNCSRCESCSSKKPDKNLGSTTGSFKRQIEAKEGTKSSNSIDESPPMKRPSFKHQGGNTLQENEDLIGSSSSPSTRKLSEYGLQRYVSPCYEVNIQAKSICDADIAGWLYISLREFKNTKMKSRYVVLKNNLLYVYRKSTNERPIFVSLLDGATCEKLKSSQVMCVTKTTGCSDNDCEDRLVFQYDKEFELSEVDPPCIISLKTQSSRLLYLSFSSEKECDSWFTLINNAGYDKLKTRATNLTLQDQSEFCQLCTII